MHRSIPFLVAAFAFLAVPAIAFAQDAGDRGTTSPDAISSFTAWAIIGGAIASVGTALVNQIHWPPIARLVVFFVICCVTAGIDAYANRELDLSNWSRALIVVVAAGWTTFLATRPALKDLELRTTLRDPVTT